MLLDGQLHRLRRDGLAAGNGPTQRILHRLLAVPGRRLQDLQVFPNALAGAVVAAQLIVGHAEVTGRKHVLPILVVLEGPRLADQRIDHMTVVDRVLAAAGQTGHPPHLRVGMPDLHEVGVDHHVHLVPDQSAGNRIRVTLDLDRAAAADQYAADALPVIQPARRQFAQARFLFGEPGRPRGVTLIGQPREEPLVLLAAGEVATAA